MHRWSDILAEARDCFRGRGRFPLRAYSESMPPPWVALKPYAPTELLPPAHGERGLAVSEYEQVEQLDPGLRLVAEHVLGELEKLRSSRSHQLSETLLRDNPAWPAELAAAATRLREPLTLCLTLALSRTQDDKGNTPWTLFGSSHLGPERPLWSPLRDDLTPLVRLLGFLTGVEARDVESLRAGGVRIHPRGADAQFADWAATLPRGAEPLLLAPGELGGVKSVFTLAPFASLPEGLRRAYLAGSVRLVPSPASIVFFEHPGYRKLGHELALAMQVPLLHLFPRRAAGKGLRIPQSGRLMEAHGDTAGTAGGPAVHTTVRRSHRFDRVSREDEDAATGQGFERPIGISLFSSRAEDVGLYGKPMARNAQIWTEDYRLVLDGPSASWEDFGRASDLVLGGGRYGYRFYYTPMRAGTRWLWWHLPLVARIGPGGETQVMADAPRGLVTAERVGAPPFELEPVLLDRPAHATATGLRREGERDTHDWRNVRRLLELSALLERPLPPSLARRALYLKDNARLEEWRNRRKGGGADPALVAALAECIGAEPELPAGADGLPPSLTFASTHTRAFEEKLWGTIESLATAEYLAEAPGGEATKDGAGTDGRNNADPAGVALPEGAPPRRALDTLARHLENKHAALIAKHGVKGAFVARQEFRWSTDFDFRWSGAWLGNRYQPLEKNVLVFIPGASGSELVVMADHYDTAYEEDVYRESGHKKRCSAMGADDNYSATATLLLAADELLRLSREKKLARSVLLVHLTGEEFPTDCLGARMLAQGLVEDSLAIRIDGGPQIPFADKRVRGVFVLDMIAHDKNLEVKPRSPVFQIATGEGAGSARLGALAYHTNQLWNRSAPVWNQRDGRPPARAPRGPALPPPTERPIMRGQLRPEWDRRSSLYNTDGQIFSDVGVPVVLFMEDYDLNRTGYHDTHDTMENIDLDYAAALAAIAIETVAQAASVESL